MNCGMYLRRMTVSRRNAPIQNRNKSYQRRRVDQFKPRKTILIVCQGIRTEPNYFSKFGTEWLTVKIHRVGKDTKSVVDKAKELKKGYEETWVVFDKDDFEDTAFDQSIQSARRSNINVAYSNECFEVWYILHFEYLNTAIPRADYFSKLGKSMDCDYSKASDSMYERLKGRMETAIVNAKKLMDEYEPSSQPSRNNPSTTVHLLVEELMEQAKPRYR